MKLLILLLSTLFALPALAADQYLCIAEKSMGFEADNEKKEWKPTAFLPSEKFIVRERKDDDVVEHGVLDGAWVMQKFGREELYGCKYEQGPFDVLCKCTSSNHCGQLAAYGLILPVVISPLTSPVNQSTTKNP